MMEVIQRLNLQYFIKIERKIGLFRNFIPHLVQTESFAFAELPPVHCSFIVLILLLVLRFCDMKVICFSRNILRSNCFVF
jgi:hypothetical protein